MQSAWSSDQLRTPQLSAMIRGGCPWAGICGKSRRRKYGEDGRVVGGDELRHSRAALEEN